MRRETSDIRKRHAERKPARWPERRGAEAKGEATGVVEARGGFLKSPQAVENT
ncbi:MAG: hypothetical protein ACNA8K_01405 [Cyclonatronaceae bacterium]